MGGTGLLYGLSAIDGGVGMGETTGKELSFAASSLFLRKHQKAGLGLIHAHIQSRTVGELDSGTRSMRLIVAALVLSAYA